MPAATAAAAPPEDPPGERVAGGKGARGFGGEGEAEFGDGGEAEGDEPARTEAGGEVAVGRRVREPLAQRRRARAGGEAARGGTEVLHQEGHAVEGAAGGRGCPIGGGGIGQALVRCEAGERPEPVQRPVQRLGGGERGLHGRDRGGAPAGDGGGERGGILHGRGQAGSLASIGTSKAPDWMAARFSSIAGTASAGTSSATKMRSLPPCFMKEYSV